jgi:hypothetical protein
LSPAKKSKADKEEGKGMRPEDPDYVNARETLPETSHGAWRRSEDLIEAQEVLVVGKLGEGNLRREEQDALMGAGASFTSTEKKSRIESAPDRAGEAEEREIGRIR